MCIVSLITSNESWCHQLNEPASFPHCHVLHSVFNARDSEVKSIDPTFKDLTNKTITVQCDTNQPQSVAQPWDSGRKKGVVGREVNEQGFF